MPPYRDHSPRLLGFARRMRHEPTDAEQCLWRILRDRRLSGFKFRRQHPVGGYIVDFFCRRAALVIELDGGQHADPSAVRYDQQRTRRLNDLGVRVLRFWDHDLLRDPQVIADTIYAELEKFNSSPDPLPEYREREKTE